MELPSLSLVLHWFHILISFYNLYLQSAWPFGSIASISGDVFKPATMSIYAEATLNVRADGVVLFVHGSSARIFPGEETGDVELPQQDIESFLRPAMQTCATLESQSRATFVTAPPVISAPVDGNSQSKVTQRLQNNNHTYATSIELDIDFADLKKLADTISRLEQLSHTRVDGLEWKLQDATREQALSACQQRAAQNLMQKAQALAASLGPDSVRAVSISEQKPPTRDERSVLRVDAEALGLGQLGEGGAKKG